MRLWGVQKGCVKIAELFVSILFAPVAQRIERRFPKPCVGGSNPLGSANLKPLENIDISVISAVFVLLAIYICCKIISLKGRLKAFGVGHLRYMLNVLLIF